MGWKSYGIFIKEYQDKNCTEQQDEPKPSTSNKYHTSDDEVMTDDSESPLIDSDEDVNLRFNRDKDEPMTDESTDNEEENSSNAVTKSVGSREKLSEEDTNSQQDMQVNEDAMQDVIGAQNNNPLNSESNNDEPMNDVTIDNGAN